MTTRNALGARTHLSVLLASLVAWAASAPGARGQTWPDLPDLVVTWVDGSGLTRNCQTGSVQGEVRARIENPGLAVAAAPFHLAFFEDRELDGALTGADALLAEVEVVEDLEPGAERMLVATISATLEFSGRPIHALADSHGVLDELNEDDNFRHSAANTVVMPRPAITPVTSKYMALPGKDVEGSLVVANLNDDDGDGAITEWDVPDILANYKWNVPGTSDDAARIIAVSGVNGTDVLFTTPDTALTAEKTEIAVGDIDGDGSPDIVACSYDPNRVVAFDNTGQVKWTSLPPVNLPGSEDAGSGIVIANLDGQGPCEVIAGCVVFDGVSGIRMGFGSGTCGRNPPSNGILSAQAAVADIDLDGTLELVAGPTAYNYVGGVLIKKWQNTALDDGYVAIGNLDEDPFAEIVLNSDTHLRVLDHEGAIEAWWTPPGGFINITGTAGGVPTIDDLDGVAPPEILVGTTSRLMAYRANGDVYWQRTIADGTSGVCGVTTFDLDGDDHPEVMHRDGTKFRILDGRTGNLIYEVTAHSFTMNESPIVADVDNDGHAEILVNGDGPATFGIYAFEGPGEGWAPARRICNQNSYHVANVREDGSIPRYERPHWLEPGLGRNSFRRQLGPDGLESVAPDLTVSLVARDTTGCPDDVVLSARIGNAGSSLARVVEVAIFSGDPASGMLLTTVETSRALRPGEFELVELEVDGPFPRGSICFSADDDGTGAGTLTEIDEENNACCSVFEDPCPPPSDAGPALLTYVGATSADHSDAAELAAILTDPSTTQPIPQAIVTFSFDGLTCRAVTDATGRASCWTTATWSGTPASVDVTSEAVPGHVAATLIPAVSFDVTPEETDLVAANREVEPLGNGTLIVSAHLRQDGAAPLQGQAMSFTAGGGPPEPGTPTDSTGRSGATFNGLTAGPTTVSATFTATGAHEESVATAEIYLLASQVRLAPQLRLVVAGQRAKVTAQVLADGGTISSRHVRFCVLTGSESHGLPDTCNGSPVDTDGNGEAPWGYTSATTSGVDVVQAHVDDDLDGTIDPDEATATTEIYLDVVTSTKLTITGDLTSDTRDPARIAAKLVDDSVVPAVPVPDTAIALSLGSTTCLGVTDSAGEAACWITPGSPAGVDQAIEASFAGGPGLAKAPNGSGTFVVTKEQTRLLMGSIPPYYGGSALLAARLWEDGALPIAGRTIEFHLTPPFSGGTLTGVTGLDGIATVTVPITGSFSVYATFAADTTYLGATSNAMAILVFAAPGPAPRHIWTAPTTTQLPGAPTITSVVRAGDGAVQVTWTAGTSGAAPIAGYVVHADPDFDAAVPHPTLTRVVTGLPNGVNKTFTVRATNAFGTGPPSAGQALMPLRVAESPTGVVATPLSETEVEVAWTPPAGVVDHYEIQPWPAGAAETANNSPHVLDGLNPGQLVAAWVRPFTDDAGPGLWCDRGAEAVTGSPPSEPLDVLGSAGDGAVTAYWRQPVDLGGNEIEWYHVTVLEDDIPAATQPGPIPGSHVHYQVQSPQAGVDYKFTVLAENVLGEGPASGASTDVRLTEAPGEPTLVAATRANGAIHLEWDPPADNGGDGPRGYLAMEVGGAVVRTALGTDDSRWVTSLANGTARTFEVKAVNSAGPSLIGSNDLSAKPARGPDAPSWTAPPTHGNASATVTWSAPADAGGEVITEYEITSVPASSPVSFTGGPPYQKLVEGLTNGVEYRFVIHAVNDAGVGARSLYSAPVTPKRRPDPAEDVVAVADGDLSIEVEWHRPADNGGAPITGYRVVAMNVTTGTPVFVAEKSTNAFTRHATFTAPALVACGIYRFDVYASNSEGESATFGSSANVRAVTTPQVPTNVVAVRGNASGSVTWSPPVPSPMGLGDGCSPITGYVARPVPGDAPAVFVAVAAPRTASFTGLANGSEYTFRVLAVNAIGEGVEAISNAVTPCSPPYAPLALTAEISGDGEISLAWIAPAWHGGCPIEGYEVSSTPSATITPTGPTTAWASALTPGVEYTFTVRAENEIGWGAWSAPAVLVAATVPHAPTDVDVRPGDTTLRACWEPPKGPPAGTLEEIGWSELLGFEVTVEAVSPPPPAPPPVVLSVDVPDTCVMIPDLTNGQIYDVSVRAINAAGIGPPGSFAGDEDQATPRALEVAALEIIPDPTASGVVGGFDTALGHIRLNVIAGAGGAEVIVTSPAGSPAWSDSPITVAEGLEHATFVIETDTVASSETVVFTASANGSSAPDDLLVLPVPSGAAPLARIVGPDDGADVWDYETFVYVQVESPSLTSWTVDTRLATSDPNSWVQIGSGTTEMTGTEQDVRFDPTLRLNGLHEIRLRAFDGTEMSEDRIHVLVRGNQKLGHFTISLVDLTIPVAGLPIQLVRTYDSRDKRMGDFGHGWRLSVSDVRIERNIPIGQGWEHVNHSGPSWLDWPQFCVEEREAHVVSVTFPMGKVYRFRPIFQVLPGNGPPCQLADIEAGWVRYVPVGFPKGKLRAVDGGAPQPHSLVTVDLNANELQYFGGAEPVFDPEIYELTVEDGTVYRLNRLADVAGPVVGGHVVWIEDRNGNRITIEADGVRSSQGNVFAAIDRRPSGDLEGMIDQIVDARGKAMTYVYDEDDLDDAHPDRTSTLGDLTEFYDRVQVAKVAPAQPEPVRYHYELEHPHHLSKVFDQVGHRPVRNVYDDDGRLTHVCDGYGASLSDPDEPGHCVTLQHHLGDAGGRLETITDRRNNQTVIQYDTHGNVLSRHEPGDSEPWVYEYREDLDLPVTEMDPLGHVKTYTYDDNGNVATLENGEHEVTSVTWGDHQELLTFQLPRGPEYTWTNAYDDNGNLLTETDPLGNVTAYTPGDHGNVAAISEPLGNVTTYSWQGGFLHAETDAGGITTEYHPDENGTPAWVRTKDGTTALDGSGMLHEFDAMGRAVKTYLPHEDAADLDDTPNWINNPFIEVVYDDAGRTIEVRDEHSPAWVTTSEYDDLGQLERVTRPDTKFEEYEYDDNGNRILTRDVTGRITQHEYDGHDRLWHTWWGPDDFDAADPHMAFAHDDGGRLSSRADELGNVTDYEYDDANRRTHVIEPDLNDGTPRAETETRYDANGWVEWIEDPLDHRTTFEYDVAGRQVTEILPDRAELPGVEQRSYEYDEAGRLIASVDENGHATTYGHDEMARLTRVTDARDGTTLYEHDGRSNVTAYVDALGRRTTHEYDTRGLRTARTLPLGQSGPAAGFRETWHHSVSGALERHVNLDGATETTYSLEPGTDLVSSIDRASEPGDENVVFGYTPDGRWETVEDARGITEYTYDESPFSRGWLNRMTRPDGVFIDYAYYDSANVSHRRTGRNGIIEHDTTYTYDERGRLETVLAPGAGTFSYTYDLAGNIDTVTYPNGVVADHDFDVMNRLDVLTWRQGIAGPAIQTYDYSPGPHVRDATGQIRGVAERGAASNRDVLYSYDELGRLTIEAIVAMTETLQVLEERVITHVYDDVGNRISRSVHVDGEVLEEVSHVHDDNDRLLSAGNTVYTWDDSGRMSTVAVLGSPPTEYAWDDDDRLISARLPNGDDLAFEYDVDGLRYARSLNAERQTFVVDPSLSTAQVLEERDVAGDILARHVHGHGLLANVGPGGAEYVVYDQVASVRALLDVAATPVETHAYEAFGEELDASAGDGCEYGFAGEQRDEALSLHYLRARLLDAATGRFVSRDPAEGHFEAPMSLHKYAYAANDPLSWMDPTGREYEPTDMWLGTIIHKKVFRHFRGWASVSAVPRRIHNTNISITRIRVENGQAPLKRKVSAAQLIPDTGIHRAAGLLRPDLIDFTFKEVYEVKPAGCESAGATQLAAYVSLLNYGEPRHHVLWSEGIDYPPPTELFPVAGHMVLVRKGKLPGLIVYWRFPGPRSPSPHEMIIAIPVSATGMGSAMATATSAAATNTAVASGMVGAGVANTAMGGAP